MNEPKWWKCETSANTPTGADRDGEDTEAFRIFKLAKGWYFWDHQCDQCFGPIELREDAKERSAKFREFITGGKDGRRNQV
jgi:hypothetical protein